MTLKPAHPQSLKQFWPAFLGAGLVYALWPLLWMGLTSSSLNRQEPNAGELFAAAPAVHFTGKPRHFQAGSFGGRYLMRNQQEIKTLASTQGWQFIDQMGAGFFFKKGDQKAGAVCRLFTRHFTVCTVTPN